MFESSGELESETMSTHGCVAVGNCWVFAILALSALAGRRDIGFAGMFECEEGGGGKKRRSIGTEYVLTKGLSHDFSEGMGDIVEGGGGAHRHRERWLLKCCTW